MSRRVLIFIYSMAGGGAERVISHLANSLVNENADVCIVTIAGEQSDVYTLDKRVQRIGLSLDKTSSGVSGAIYRNLARVHSLRHVIREYGPNVVLSFMTESNIVALLASSGLNHRVVVSERIFPPAESLSTYWSWLRRKCYPWADSVVVQTTATSNWVIRNCPKTRVNIIPNAAMDIIDQEPFVSVDAHSSPEEHIILSLSQLRPQKGIDRLIDSFASLSPQIAKGWVLVIAGDGPLDDELRRQAAGKNLHNRVRFVGRVGNVGDWYRRADIFVLSSYYEGFPNALLEAMAIGAAVISVDCNAGPRDIISHDVDGLLVSNSEPQALANAITRLISNPQLRNRLGEHAERSASRFSEKSVLKKWRDILFSNKN